MVANEIAGSGQVDVFLGGGSRWTTSSTGITSVTCQASRLSGVTTTPGGGGGGGVVGATTASAHTTTTPPGGDAVNLSQQLRYGPHSTADRHRTTAAAAQGWADTRQPSPDIGPSETDEKGLPPPQSPRPGSSSSVDVLDRVQQQQQQKRSVGNSCLDSGSSSSASGAVHYRVVSSSDGSGLRINNNISSATVGGSTGGQSDGEDSVIEVEQQQPSRKSINIIHAGVVNDALDAPQKSDDQQHDDKMPRQSHYDSGSVQQQHQHAQWQTQGGGGGDCDEINNTSLSSSSSSSGGGGGGGVPLKSALKRPTAGRCGGVAGTLQQLQSLRKKARVRFNEALNTFLECDYVIYVDDDEYDLLYHLDAVAAAAAAAAQAEAELADLANVSSAAPLVITTTEQPQLVNVRSFELQLPETSTCVSHGPVTGSAAPAVVASTGEAGTLSPPDGYKDAAAFYAAAAALVDLENHVHLSGKWHYFPSCPFHYFLTNNCAFLNYSNFHRAFLLLSWSVVG
ncbi:hypothetical protein DAPPUDRAFT_96684 [Daphnia pulex]|uniref:Uncharacterized protein n=1 Tax=Daphnia pulex TaxID=6669 RepID=E9FYL1_DAPPU|nr:hypothetical protein DAPPUDRAFT_96684 [Daphnia pulex]|eukprot:EFX87747.1 hypothetical protein DAPPUDRAFT_96684 [Daphnia pulex]